MLELSSSQVSFIVMGLAAILAILITYSVSKKFKIPNPNFSLARATSTFFIIWLLWGDMVKTLEANTASETVGLFKYLTINHTKQDSSWLAQLSWDGMALGITVAVTVIGTALLSFVITRLGDISDRRR